MTLLSRIGLAVALAWCAGHAVAAPVPGTHVDLDPPEGFVAAQQFPGFQQAESGSSIAVTEIQGPVDKLSAGFTAEGLASRGMTLLDEQPVQVDGRDARLLHVAQVAAGVQYRKLIAVFGDQAQTVLLTATFPTVAAERLFVPMTQALLSARWDPSRQVGTFEGLPFRVQETASLKVANRMANMVLLNASGARGPASPEDPLVVVGASVGKVGVDNIETFAKQRLAQTAEVVDLTVQQGEAATIADLPAYELVAEALDHQTGTPLTVYQVIAVDNERYFLIQGLVGRNRAATFLPQVRELARSLEVVR